MANRLQPGDADKGNTARSCQTTPCRFQSKSEDLQTGRQSGDDRTPAGKDDQLRRTHAPWPLTPNHAPPCGPIWAILGGWRPRVFQKERPDLGAISPPRQRAAIREEDVRAGLIQTKEGGSGEVL